VRKVAFADNEETKKVMLYETNGQTYLFYFNTWVDAPCAKDYLYTDIEEAEAICLIEFDIKTCDWININDPQINCQDDFIAPTRVKGSDVGNPQFGKYERFNGKWFDIEVADNDIGAMSGNERLFLSGLIDEFDYSKSNNDILKGRRILQALKWDELSLNHIIEKEFYNLH